MGNVVFNAAKGRVVELHDRVKAGDPATSRLVVIPVDGSTSDATLVDCADYAACLAAGLTERSSGGWGRKTLAAGDIAASTVDTAGDRRTVTLPSQTWTEVTAGATTRLLVCYSPVTSPTNAQLVPLVALDFAVTPSGADEIVTFADYFRAT